ncbi:MAG TPA: hypothetical protein VFV99_20290, partial [Kofleriaceae bacterium]|nr:hypothetical protein [Kofleriaceae bacterium]
AGGLYVAKLDETGRQLSHTSLPAEPPITGMAMTSLGLLAWRADQTFALIDVDGATKERLGTEPQQRIIAVATNAKRAVVLLEREGSKRQARWLTLEPKLAWGGWITLDGDLTNAQQIALSPSGKRLAMLAGVSSVGQQKQTPPVFISTMGTVFDIAKAGKVLVTGLVNNAQADVGFADDDHVAFGGFQGLSWVDLKDTTPKAQPITTPASAGSRTEAMLATGGGRAVSPMNGDLVISTPEKTQYLGYDTISPRIAEVGPDGQLLVSVGNELLLLDQSLKMSSLLTPFKAGTTGTIGQVAELHWLGDNDWLFESTTPSDPTMQISLVDAKGFSTQVRKGIKEVQILGYEPSSQLVTLSFGAESEVARYDRKGKKLDRIASVKKASPYEQVMFVPVSAAASHGTQLVQITMREKSTVKWFRDAGALDKPSATVTVEGPFAGADAAGHVFMWRNTPTGQLELVLYADGKPLRTLPNNGAVALWPEPSGKRYVEVAQSSVALYDLDGKQLWYQQIATSQEALWLTDGAIAITSAGGVARLDPATGAVTAARCGWRFSLADKPHPAPPRVEPLCSQLRRSL